MKLFKKIAALTPLPDAETYWPPDGNYPDRMPGRMLTSLESTLRAWATESHETLIAPENRNNKNLLDAAFYRREAYLEVIELLQERAQQYAEQEELQIPEFMDA